MTRRHRIPLADDTRGRGPDAEKSASGCRCTNHMGTRKNAFKTQDAALDFALRHTRHTGQARVYKCPSSDRWHVATRRQKGSQ